MSEKINYEASLYALEGGRWIYQCVDLEAHTMKSLKKAAKQCIKSNFQPEIEKGCKFSLRKIYKAVETVKRLNPTKIKI